MVIQIVGIIVAIVVTGIVIAGMVARQRQEQRQARIHKEGETVLCWIVMAHADLYRRPKLEAYGGPLFNDTAGGNAQVVFSLEKPADLRRQLERIAGRLPTFQALPGEGEDERIIASVMKSHHPYFRPLRIPDRVTDGLATYTVSVAVFINLLPDYRLQWPYVYCKVVLGEEGGAFMVEYPDEAIPRPGT
jgi:hypothetical protein